MRSLKQLIVFTYQNFWLDLIFPKQCLSCRDFGRYICQSCFDSIPLLKQQRCIVCQEKSLYGFTHPKCKSTLTPDRLITIYRYQEPLIAKVIKIGKYQFIPDLFRELAYLTTSAWQKNISSINAYSLCAIPLHTKKLRWRGFNQSRALAEVYADNLIMPMVDILKRNKHTLPQKDLNQSQRKQNTKDAFAFIKTSNSPTKVILIDDITTSGATFLEACKTLKRSGVKEVICLAVTQD